MPLHRVLSVGPSVCRTLPCIGLVTILVTQLGDRVWAQEKGAAPRDGQDERYDASLLEVIAKTNSFGGSFYRTKDHHKWNSGSNRIPEGQPAYGLSFAKDERAMQLALKAIRDIDCEEPLMLDLYLTTRDGCDKVVEVLCTMRNLTSLRLHGPLASDETLKAVARIRTLRVLELGCTPYVSPAGIKRLAELKKLQSLRLYQCSRLTPAANAETWRPLANLEDLSTVEILYQSYIDDAQLAELAKIRNLKVLYLYRAQVTDTGIRSLYGLTTLQELSFPNATTLTNAAVEECRLALPSVKVSVSAPTD